MKVEKLGRCGWGNKGIKKTAFSLLMAQSISLAPMAFGGHVPLPVPKRFTITSAQPLKGLWEGLSEQEKKLGYHLQNAARAGRLMLFHQSHRHSLMMKATFELALSAENFAATQAKFSPEAFKELMTYVAQFEDQGGPYSVSNKKFYLQKVTPEQVRDLFNEYANPVDPERISEIVKLLTDANYEVTQRPEDPKGSDLALTGGNIYQKGLTGADIEAAIASGVKIDLNCQVVKTEGKVGCSKMTTRTPGEVGAILRNVVSELKKALPYATTDHQRNEILNFIGYFETGDVELFRQANVHWVQDRTSSKIDFMMGFVEIYDDYKGNVGTWESYVQIVDPKMTQVSQRLAKSAQYFEEKMPYGQWKKKFPADYSPPAMMVYYFQEIAGMRSGGYNLPNFDDLRGDPNVGAKNVIRLPLPGDAENPQRKAMLVELYQTFGQKERAEELANQYQLQRKVLVLLHEIIGHGSGTYDVTKYKEKEDPIAALGSAGSALEEQRADLAALVFAADPRLVEVGIYPSQQEATKARNAMYDIYLIDFMKVISKSRSFAESHMRGHWLLVNQLLQQGAVGWALNDSSQVGQPLTPENQVMVVKDYELFWSVCNGLLEKLQSLKANRLEAELADLMSQVAPLAEIEKPWAQAIIKRGEDLLINAGSFEQTWTIDAKRNFKILGETNIESVSQGWSKIGQVIHKKSKQKPNAQVRRGMAFY